MTAHRAPRTAALCLAVLFTLAACASSAPSGAGREPGDTTPVPHVTGAASWSEPTEPLAARPAAATASLSMAILDGWLGALIPTLPPEVPRILEELVGPDAARVVSSPHPLHELGVDIGGMAVLVLAAADPSTEPLVQRLRSAAAAASAGTTARAEAAGRGAFGQLGPAGALRVRFSVPVVQPDTLLRAVRAMVRETRAGQEMPAVPGYDVAWRLEDDAAVGVWHDASNLVLETWVPLDLEGRGEAFGARGAAALARARLETIVPDTSVTAGGDAVARFALDPPAVARLGALHGYHQVERALTSVAPEMQDAIRATGIAEACKGFALIETPRGPLVRAVRGRARAGTGGFEGELVTDVGSAWPQDPAAWRPSPSLDLSGVPLAADVDVRWLRGFRFPDGSTTAQSTVRDIEEAGFWGFLLALPLAGPIAVHRAVEEVPDLMASARFERVGVLAQGPDETGAVAFGLLPAGTTRAQAACALSDPDGPCGRTQRLTVGRVQALGTRFARLVAVGNRFAVLLAGSRDDLDHAPLRLTAAPVPAVRLEVAAQAMQGVGAGLSALAPGRTGIELQSDGTQLRVVAHPLAASTPVATSAAAASP